jgi:uracil-DNA glycosylase
VAAIRKRASQLLGRPAVPGADYVNSAVVHCKSKGEHGVREAAETCVRLFLRRMIEESGAKVIVCLCDFAARAVKKEFRITDISEAVTIDWG